MISQLMKLHVWLSSVRPATAWVGSNLWVTTPHTAIRGDVNMMEDVQHIFASMREVVTLDLREGSDLAEALYNAQNLWCRKLQEVWTAAESVFFVQKLAQGRIDDRLLLTKVIWEHFESSVLISAASKPGFRNLEKSTCVFATR
ncbi:hypothetical protein B0H17DRAFT_1140711 [Mycena rosella]|uniref:Uncharacterized protein n=1 Tax=Mycena rosella TaxID=1033263 RepID=A0AAD7D175_MYCRO|nr:hypothetical protein B0H17DRAFT_1140711 [Mycena rosella]